MCSRLLDGQYHNCKLEVRGVWSAISPDFSIRLGLFFGQFQWLFQNVIQAQPHGGENPILLYQEMWLRWRRHVSTLPSAATLQLVWFP